MEFEIDGQAFTALNGGPVFKFNESVSFQVYCDTQEEIDYYWNKLSDCCGRGPLLARTAARSGGARLF